MPVNTYKISELPSSTTISNNDLLVIVNTVSSITKKLTAQQLLAYITGSTFNTLNVTAGSITTLNATTVNASTAVVSTISASVISASSYVNLPYPIGAGAEGSVQYNSGGYNTGSADKLVVDYANNRLGIGINLPQAPVHIKNTGEIVRLDSTTTRGNGTNYLTFHDPVGRKGYIGYGGTANDHFNIVNAVGAADITLLTSGTAGNTEKMRITSEGKVGIGTTSPDAALEIEKSANNFLLDLTNANEPSFKLRTYNSGTSITDTLSFTQGLFYDNTENAAIRFHRGLGSTDGFLSLSTSGIERVRFDKSGNVGIGTASPSQKLHVSGGSALIDGGGDLRIRPTTPGANGAIKFFDTAGSNRTNIYFAGTDLFRISDSAGVDKLIINSAGNVGIGTTSPAAKLDVSSGTDAWATFGASATAASFMSFKQGGTSNNIGYIGTDGGGIVVGGTGNNFGIRSENDLILMSNAAEKARLTSAGNLGVGTTSPGSKLDVNGSINILNSNNLTWGGAFGANIPTIAGTSGVSARIGFYPAGSTSGESVTLTSTGLGLGTNSPGSRLHVKSTAEVIRIESTATRGTGQNYIGFYDPTGRKAYIGNGSISNDDLHISNDLNAAIIFSTNGTERLNINASSGNVSINNGNLVIGTSGKGIDFSNTTPDGTGATVSSELLDDYEEGTFTPSLIGPPSVSYTTQAGKYIKIGNKVTVSANIVVSTITTNANAVSIAGLPFPCSSTANINYTSNIIANLLTINIVSAESKLTPSSTSISINRRAAAAASSFPIVGTDLQSSSQIICTLTYFTD